MAQQHLSRLLAGLMPTGLLGLSVALAPPTEAAVRPSPVGPVEPAAADVATRLSAIRAAVTAAVPDMPAGPDASVGDVWFGNHGWGRPWRWGGGGWGNGGWGRRWGGGWGNGGWGNGGWNNWHPWGNF